MRASVTRPAANDSITSSVPRRVGAFRPGDVLVAADAPGEPSPEGTGEPINYGPSRHSTPGFCWVGVSEGSVAPVSGFGEPLAGGELDGVVGVVFDVDDVSLQSGSMCSVRSNLTAARAPSRPLSLRMPA